MGLFNWGRSKPEPIFEIGDIVQCYQLPDRYRGFKILVSEKYQIRDIQGGLLFFYGIDNPLPPELFRIVKTVGTLILESVHKFKEKTMRVNNLTKHLGNSAAVEQAINSGDNSLRCTGRTTGLAFEYIAQAYKNPNQWIEVYDHCRDYPSRRNLLKQIQHILVYLDYKHFEFSKIDCKFRFNLWGEEIQSEDFVVVGGKRYKLVKE